MGRKKLTWFFLKKKVKPGGEMESQLFRISSRARVGVGEALKKVNNGEMMSVEVQGHPAGCFLP